MRRPSILVPLLLLASAPLAAQTLSILADLNPGAASSNPAEVVFLDGFALFAADHPTLGRELWRTDGTPGGTFLLLDVNPGSGSSNPERLVRAGNYVFFWAHLAGFGSELWRSDGTAAGTILLKDIQAGGNGQLRNRIAALGAAVYFAGYESVDNELELWTSDGTPAGTVQAADINPGAPGSGPADLTVIGSTLLFTAFEPATGRELWKYEGGAATLVVDLVPGTGSPFIANPTAAGSHAYFYANLPTFGSEPWRTDGTAAGTVSLGDLEPGAGHSNGCCFHEVGSWVLFAARTNATGAEIWRTDGTAAGTQVLEINAGPQDSVNPSDDSYYGVWNGRLYFNASDPVAWSELWASDGTAAGTVLVADVYPGANHSSPQSFQTLGGHLYFTATASPWGRDLWRTDGTTAGTEIFANLNGNSSSDPLPIGASSTRFYFRALDAALGVEPWYVELPPVLEDFGDAPDPGYPTLLASDGARHEIGVMWLGGVPDAAPDAEPDGLPSAAADGDDLDGEDDEDGVAFLDYLVQGGSTRLSVTATCEPKFGPCAPHLDAWIDFDADGDWGGAGEQIFDTLALAEGQNLLEIDTPAAAALGPTYARFRLSQLGGLLPFGGATEGEVEDCAVEILPEPVYDGDFDDGTFGDWIVVTP